MQRPDELDLTGFAESYEEWVDVGKVKDEERWGGKSEYGYPRVFWLAALGLFCWGQLEPRSHTHFVSPVIYLIHANSRPQHRPSTEPTRPAKSLVKQPSFIQRAWDLTASRAEMGGKVLCPVAPEALIG